MLWPILSSAIPAIRGDGSDVRVIEPMSGMKDHPQSTAAAPASVNAASSRARLRGAWRIGITPGMQLDGLRPAHERGIDLIGMRVDEQADLETRVLAASNRLGDPIELADDIEPPLGGQLRPAARARA